MYGLSSPSCHTSVSHCGSLTVFCLRILVSSDSCPAFCHSTFSLSDMRVGGGGWM